MRLDVTTDAEGQEHERAMGDALKSLDHLTRTGRLAPRRIGKSRTFATADVLALVAGNGRVPDLDSGGCATKNARGAS